MKSFEQSDSFEARNSSVYRLVPRSNKEAIARLMRLVSAVASGSLGSVDELTFRKGWHAIYFVCPGLHPDCALDDDKVIAEIGEDLPSFAKKVQHVFTPYYVRSGWPVLLMPIAQEAWRRYERNEMNDEDFYCSKATRAGIVYRRTKRR